MPNLEKLRKILQRISGAKTEADKQYPDMLSISVIPGHVGQLTDSAPEIVGLFAQYEGLDVYESPVDEVPMLMPPIQSVLQLSSPFSSRISSFDGTGGRMGKVLYVLELINREGGRYSGSDLAQLTNSKPADFMREVLDVLSIPRETDSHRYNIGLGLIQGEHRSRKGATIYWSIVEDRRADIEFLLGNKETLIAEHGRFTSKRASNIRKFLFEKLQNR